MKPQSEIYNIIKEYAENPYGVKLHVHNSTSARCFKRNHQEV